MRLTTSGPSNGSASAAPARIARSRLAAERLTAEFFARFEHRFVLAHLKDVGEQGAEVDTPEFGTGVFPQRMYLEFLRARRFDLPLILEHLPPEHIPAAIRRVDALLV